MIAFLFNYFSLKCLLYFLSDYIFSNPFHAIFNPALLLLLTLFGILETRVLFQHLSIHIPVVGFHIKFQTAFSIIVPFQELSSLYQVSVACCQIFNELNIGITRFSLSCMFIYSYNAFRQRKIELSGIQFC